GAGVASGFAPRARCRCTVFSRAMSRRTARRRSGSSSGWLAARNRRLNCSRSISLSRAARSASDICRISSARIGLRLLANDKLALHTELGGRQRHRRLRDVTRHTFELEHDAARLHDRHPRIRRSLALTHADFRRLLGDRLVREDPDPDLAATLDVTGHGDTRRLDLAARYPARLLRRQTEGPERHGVAA